MKWVSDRLLNNCTLTSLLKTCFFFKMMCENLNLARSPNSAGQSGRKKWENWARIKQPCKWWAWPILSNAPMFARENMGVTHPWMCLVTLILREQKIRKVAVVFLHLAKRVMSIHFHMSGWSSPCWSPLQSSSRCADVKPCADWCFTVLN